MKEGHFLGLTPMEDMSEVCVLVTCVQFFGVQ